MDPAQHVDPARARSSTTGAHSPRRHFPPGDPMSTDPAPGTEARQPMHAVTPHLICADASDAIAFYVRAFGAVELARLPGPDGKLMHALIRIGDSHLMLNDEFPAYGALGPKARGGTSVTLQLRVPDADAAFARAVEAGATVVMPLADQFWGDRYGVVADPCGHHWSIATQVRALSAEEIQAAMAQLPPPC
jgi:PhnB protein